MYEQYPELLNSDDLYYEAPLRTLDIQFPRVINLLLLVVWFIICLIGLVVIWRGRNIVMGAFIIGVPTILGMIIKPSFALCLTMLVLTGGVGIAYEGIFTLTRGVGIALAVTFFLNLLISRPHLRVSNKTLWIILAFSLWVAIAPLWAPDPEAEFRSVRTQIQLLILVFVLYWIIELNSETAFRWVLRSYVLGGLGANIWLFISGQAQMVVEAARGRYAAALAVEEGLDPNYLGANFVLLFLTVIYLFLRDRNIFWRAVYLVGILFMPILIVKTGSRGAVLAFALTIMLPLLFLRQVVRRPVLAISLFLLIVLTAGSITVMVKRRTLAVGAAERLTERGLIERALGYRIETMQRAIEISTSRPLGTTQTGWPVLSGYYHYPHNDLCAALGLFGYPGAVLYVAIIIMVTLTVKRMPLGIEKLYARALLTFLVLMGISVSQLNRKYFWVFIAMTLVMERISWLHQPKAIIEVQDEEETANTGNFA